MNKGVNTIILNAKETLAETINSVLKEGVPPVVVSMIVEGLYNELDVLAKKTIEKENEQVQKQQELNDSQVLYDPKDNQGLNTEGHEED